MNPLENIYLFFFSETWQGIVSILKPVCLLAIFIFLLAIIWALAKSPWLNWYVIWDSQDFLRGEPVPFQKKTQLIWKKIKKELASRKATQWKLAVIEGGKIVEDVLFKMGYKGKNIKEKLETATEAQIPNLKDLMAGAEIYDHVLSDPDYKLDRREAVFVLQAFEEFLEYFEYL